MMFCKKHKMLLCFRNFWASHQSRQKQKRGNISKLLNEHGLTITDNIKIADEFNKFFSSVGNQLAKEIKTNKSYKIYLKNSNQNNFFLSPTTEYEINKIINKLNSKKASGTDNIKAKLSKGCGIELCKGLAHITNLSFVSGNYPDQLKIAQVIPLYKKCESYFTKNYRLISLLRTLNKIIVKLVHKCFYQKYEIFYKFQFGFRKGHSTSLANIELVEKIREEIQNGKFVLGAYLDLLKHLTL